MAYEQANPIKPGAYTGKGRSWYYDDGDNLADIDASGYFNAEAAKLKVGDAIFVNAGNGYGLSIVVSNTRDLAASPPVQGVVDTSNAVALGAIDSD